MGYEAIFLLTLSNAKNNLIELLSLSEKLSRHINGSATPVIGKNGQKIIDKIYETGYYSVSGGNLTEILKDIQNLLHA